jgi:hypothetical protein
MEPDEIESIFREEMARTPGPDAVAPRSF